MSAPDDGGYAEQETSRISTLDELGRRLDELAARVEQLFGRRAGGGGQPREAGQEGRAPTVLETADARKREIREELAALRRQEKADADAALISDRVGKLERMAERKPRELRKVEKFMRWGDE